MKIAVVGGAGAMGGVWASRLSAAGYDVTIVDVAAEALVAINRIGLTIETVEGPTVYQIPATSDPGKLGMCDAVIFFAKAHHTQSAAELIRPVVGPETTVVTLQNGWGNADTLAGVFDPNRLVMGVTYLGATVTAPGHIAFTLTQGVTYLGPYLPEALLDRAQAVGDAMNASGLVTTVTADVLTEIWKKLILNSAGLPVSALSRLTSGALGMNEAALLICDSLTIEAVAVARAKGLKIDEDERIATLRALLARAGSGKASMLQDVEAKRKTEIKVINGAIVREADALGIPVPLHRTMLTLVQTLETSWSQ